MKTEYPVNLVRFLTKEGLIRTSPLAVQPPLRIPEPPPGGELFLIRIEYTKCDWAASTSCTFRTEREAIEWLEQVAKHRGKTVRDKWRLFATPEEIEKIQQSALEAFRVLRNPLYNMLAFLPASRRAWARMAEIEAFVANLESACASSVEHLARLAFCDGYAANVTRFYLGEDGSRSNARYRTTAVLKW
jgi:hypothetical protein